MKNLVKIATVTKPHGIKGAFSIYLISEKETILDCDMQVLLKPTSSASSLPKDGQPFQIEKISVGNKGIISFKNVTDRTTAEAMLPFAILVDRAEFPETEENQYYLVDLIGLDSIDHFTKLKVGSVRDYYENGAQVVLVIALTSGELVELPFVDNFFPEVDIENKFVEVIFPEFLE